MKLRELQEKQTEELKRLYTDFCDKRQELNFKVSSKQLKNVREIRVLRQNIAQVLTILKQRELEQELESNK